MSSRLRNLNPYELHKYLVNIYSLNTVGSTATLIRNTSSDRTDLDVIREHHKFLWEDDDAVDTWEKQLAKKYYDKLFKEYCICDLTKYKENKVALRWRIEKEVVLGKGQFQCGNKLCIQDNNLKSWEVNFAYTEDNEKKNALVKLRLCPECSNRLNYKSKKREIKRIKKIQKKKTKNKQLTDSPQEKPLRTPSPEPVNESTGSTKDIHTAENKEQSLWSKECPETEEKTREEEFEEYLADLLL